MMENDSILEVRNLSTYFPAGRNIKGIKAIDDISFSLRKGEILGIAGESGCGKTTLVRSIAQLYRPTSGSVYFRGRDLCSLDNRKLSEERRYMQMVFQNPYSSLDLKMRVDAIIAEPLRIYNRRGLLEHRLTKDEMERCVDILLDKVNLSRKYKERYPKELSGGEAQRVAIARAIALKPDVILADEAVSSLDVSIQLQILSLLKSLKDEMGISFIFISHDLKSIERIATRVAIMYKGRIVEICPAVSLDGKVSHPYTKALLSATYVADPAIEKKRKRIILDGELSTEETDGCPFHPRCKERTEYCTHHAPKLERVEESHCVSCWMRAGLKDKNKLSSEEWK